MAAKPVKYNTGLKYNSGVVYNGTVADNQNPVMANSTDTPIVVNITPAQKTAILAKIAELAALFTWTIGLSDDERRTLPKLGDKTAGWDEKIAGYMASRPELVPSYVDTTTLTQNRQVWRDLGDLKRALADITQRLDDTDMKVGSQVYKPDLAIYNSVGEAAKHGVPGAQAIYDDLKTRFPGHTQTAAAKAAKAAAQTAKP